MAEQNSHDVVEQTLSGGDPSPSDVPASTNDKQPAGGDVRETETFTSTAQIETQATAQQYSDKANTLDTQEKDAGSTSVDTFKSGPGPVESRALELNGLSSVSDLGEDTASQGGSESDASRTDGRQHARTGSSKKTATFKPVSFAKFSVPKAPGATAPSKISEKASLPQSTTTGVGTSQPGSRPRLVAKTTSSLRDSLLKTATSSAKPGGVGPDPNQVWNKNRPAQPPPPKHLTDEELKQQYGIHMTSRIQEDGGGTESKWADIDDDEDDWAPETIEWTDGTKVTLTHSEPAPLSNQNEKTSREPKDELPQPDPMSNREPMRIIPKPTTSIGPNPTVLRLGANAERQAKIASSSAKGPGDKLPPASTSSAPVPAKSPWAPLPPVERISPIMPPVQVQTQPPPRTSFTEPQSPEAGNGPAALKEIAADDFNRTWRDSQSDAPRELYNSRSGRYEPVLETRKGTWRGDQSFRAPSLLQRQPPSEHTGPAEPSPAFQTHRLSGQDGPSWTRRRASSNVSGSSGSFGRRMSIGRSDGSLKPAEPRRASQVNGMIDLSISSQDAMHPRQGPVRGPSPARHGPSLNRQARTAMNEAAAPEPTAAISDDSPTAPTAPTAPTVPAEDPVAMQERIMKEKRLEARRRRLEQEEREEAQKRERIRLKLEALGPAPEKSRLKVEDVAEVNKSEVTAPAPRTNIIQSPPKPPVPEPSGEPKQYGMMKVHPPETVKKLVATHEKAAATASHARHVSSPGREPKVESTQVNGIRQPADQIHERPNEPKIDDKGTHWRGNLAVSSPYSPWSSSSKLGGASSSVANPWKPLSNDKTLGNGIFEQSLGTFPGRDLPLRGHLSLDQQPIGLKTNTGDRLGSSQTFTVAQRGAQDSTTVSPLPSPDARHTSYDALSSISRPAPIGPPSALHQGQTEAHRANGTAAWNNFHVVAAQKEAEENEKLRQEMTTMRDRPSALQVTLNETWKQVRAGDQFGQRQIIGTERTTDCNNVSANPLPGFDHSVGGLPFTENHSRPFGSLSVRGSRFFPHATEPPRKTCTGEEPCLRSPSPPPPEEISSHPVFTGDSNRPLVHLPAPKPIVKLPPRVVAPLPSPPTFASMAAAPAPARAVPPHHVSTATSWQEKFNGLFGKKTAVDKKTALAVSSASKEPLDVQLHVSAVSVSFPQYAEGDIQPENGEMTSKQVEEEEEMFEDREVGSLPVVRVPDMAPPAAWHAAPPPPSRLRSKNLKPMQVHSVEPYLVGLLDIDDTGNILVSIRFPGSVLAKTMTFSKKAGGHTQKTRGSSHFKPRRNNHKARDGSGGLGNGKSPGPQQNNGSASAPRHLSKNASWGPRPFSSGA